MKLVQLILSLYFLALGVFMLTASMTWYQITPGVVETGPFNMHFAMDIGLVFIACGGLFGVGVLRKDPSLMIAGALWPAMHALFHIYIWFSRDMALDLIAFTNLFGIQLPGWVAFYFGLSAQKEA